MMQFISDNYVWIIIIVVILLLAFIGYLADKQGFGANMKKNNKDKKEDNFVPTAEPEVPVEDAIGDDEVPAEELTFDENGDLPIEEPADEIGIEEPVEEETEESVIEDAAPVEETTEETAEVPVEETTEEEKPEEELEPIEIDDFEPEEKGDDFFPGEEKSEKDADLKEAVEGSESSDEDEIWKF